MSHDEITVVGEEKSEETHHVALDLKEQRVAIKTLTRADSLELEAGKLRHSATKGYDRWTIFCLTFQSIGVVYGDLGTSPLYVLPSVFPDGIKHNDDLLGVLSIIFYTLTLIPLTKYVFIVLSANDNGEGGTFALYSLICRYAKRVSLIPNQQVEDQQVSNFQLEVPNQGRFIRASKLKSRLENSMISKYVLLFVTMLGTSMVLGDGILTPSISVLSAVGGITEATPKMTQDMIVWISVVILIFLFSVQRFGTDKVGSTFAPILTTWFLLIFCIGGYNFFKHDPSVIKALNPYYIVKYFERNKKQAWISLGGIVLCTTGSEALFADLGHFTVRSIQFSMCCLVYPSIVLAYTGQIAYLLKHNGDALNAFYKSTPGPMYWPMFVVAVMGAIIASQSLISASFSIIQQSLSLGCFPRVKVVHTSSKYEGQVYVPEINYLLMLACVAVTLGFRTTAQIGNAYGIAVVFVMTLTSCLLVLIMIMIWKTPVYRIIAYVLVIGSVELAYLTSVLYKFDQGGYLPLAFAAVLISVMYVWNSVYRKKYTYELDNKVSSQQFKQMVAAPNLCRVPGIAIFYSELVHGIPPIFRHYITNVPALHSVLIFLTIKSLPISKVPVEERFLFRRVQPHGLNIFGCVVRYGYTDVRKEHDSFENTLVERLKEYIKDDLLKSLLDAADRNVQNDGANSTEKMNGDGVHGEGIMIDEEIKEEVIMIDEEIKEEVVMLGDIDEVINRGFQAGIIHLIGESDVVAAKGAGFWNKIVINYAYNFITRSLRQAEKVFDIPHKRLLKVGMTYEL